MTVPRTRPGAETPICIAGPTAIGKSAVALAIARRLPVEIISVDSAQVYRGMDIGTAKPDAAERAAVPHHLIDIRDPTERYSAAEFVADVRRLTADIRARHRTPLLVGGTMLYFKALFQGLDALPAADATVRAAIDARAHRLGWPALHAELARIDPATASRLAPGDRQRIQRALEVWEITGQPISTLQTRGTAGTIPTPPGFFSLEPEDRAWLHARIARRLDAMLAGGLVAEVQALLARWPLVPGMPSMRCVGYRQVLEVLHGHAPQTELLQRAAAATRQLAKRQLTWLRRMPERHRLTMAETSQPEAIAECIMEQLPRP